MRSEFNRKKEIEVFHKDLLSPRVTEVKSKERTLQALCCRAKNGLGIGFGGKEGK